MGIVRMNAPKLFFNRKLKVEFHRTKATTESNFVFTGLITVLFTLGGLGCNVENDNFKAGESIKITQEIATVRYMDIKKPGLEATLYFHPNEIPALRIQSSGRVDSLLVINTDTQKIIRGEILDLRPGKLFYQPLLKLKAGDYIAYIHGKGVAHNTFCKFTVLDY